MLDHTVEGDVRHNSDRSHGTGYPFTGYVRLTRTSYVYKSEIDHSKALAGTSGKRSN